MQSAILPGFVLASVFWFSIGAGYGLVSSFLRFAAIGHRLFGGPGIFSYSFAVGIRGLILLVIRGACDKKRHQACCNHLSFFHGRFPSNRGE